FATIPFNAPDVREKAITALRDNHSVIIHTRDAKPTHEIGPALGRIARDILDSIQTRRILIAGGDTSGQIARALNIESLEMIAPLTRGSPLCRATAPNSPADGIEITFKGGQIGPVDFFTRVANGVSDA